MNSTNRKRTWIQSAFGELSFSQNSLTDSSTAGQRILRKTKSTDAILSDKQQQQTSNNSSIKFEPKRSCIFASNAQQTTATATTTTATTTKQLQQNNRNWIDSFAPNDITDLALHAKKLTDLQNWFLHCDALRKRHPAQFCLITGPSGAGKTAAVRVVANAVGYQMQEWINPVDREQISTYGDQERYGQTTHFVTQLESFKSFLLRASRYKSLLEQQRKRLLVVEDFPNVLLKDVGTFERLLDDYMEYGKSPLIFIVADTKSRGLNISYNLFSEQIKDKYKINHISFNPIATTLMQKAMKRFCQLMRQQENAKIYQVPTQQIIDSIVISAQGDIRNALINLHFAALKAAIPISTTTTTKTTTTTTINGTATEATIFNGVENATRKRKKTQQTTKITTLKSVGRDESITMLHALGRVFNPKFTNEQKFLHSPEELTDCFTTEPKRFVDFMHSNYLLHYSEIEHVSDAIDGLTISDVILTEYRENALAALGLNVGIRGVMLANKTPVIGWLPIRGPKRQQQQQQQQQQNVAKQMTTSTAINVTKTLYATEYESFVKIIDAATTTGTTTINNKQNDNATTVFAKSS